MNLTLSAIAVSPATTISPATNPSWLPAAMPGTGLSCTRHNSTATNHVVRVRVDAEQTAAHGAGFGSYADRKGSPPRGEPR